MPAASALSSTSRVGNPNKILQQGLTVLDNLAHRGACGCEANTGDGAGVLLQIPHAFFKSMAPKAKVDLPGPGEYGVGMGVSAGSAATAQKECRKRIEDVVKEEGQKFLGWRMVPTSNASLGETAKAAEATPAQFFIGRNSKLQDDMAFERKLFVIRKHLQNQIRYSGEKAGEGFYVCSLSARTIVYKGMLISYQVPKYYPDLTDPAMETALSLVHSRFSTNTFPSWERSHPYRFVAQPNGEINTPLRGNINWMHASPGAV